MSYGRGQYPFWEKNRADSASMDASFQRSRKDECEKELEMLKIKIEKILELLEKLHKEEKINKIMNKKRIIIISVFVILTIIIISPVFTAGSSFFSSPISVILSTIDFVGTEKDYREIIEITSEAKLFRETFGDDVNTSYSVDLGIRKMILFTDYTSLKFTQHWDRTIVIHYWCNENEGKRISGYVTSSQTLQESGCF